MAQQGVVTTVTTTDLGSHLSVDAASGATTVTVDVVLDFNEGGGTLRLNGVTYTYTAADYDALTLTIPAGLTGAAVAGDRVDVLVDGDVVSNKWADVMQEHADDAQRVRVPHALWGLIPDGIRVGGNERVQFEKHPSGEWVLTDVLGKAPQLDGAILDPATVPPAATDGEPPGAAPVLTARSGIGSIAFSWTAVPNADPYRFKLFVATSPGIDTDVATPVVITASSSHTYVPIPADFTGTYYAVVLEFDEDGDGPPSAEVSAQLRQADNDSISALYAYLGDVLMEQLQTGNMTADMAILGKATSRPNGTGAGYDLNSDGLLFYDPSGMQASAFLPQNSKFKGDGEIENMTVTGQASIRKLLEIARGAVATLGQGSTPPAAGPSALVGWPDPVVLDAFSGKYGLAWTGTEFAAAATDVTPPQIRFQSSSPISLTGLGGSEPIPYGGVVKIGSNWFTLGFNSTPDFTLGWYVSKYDATGSGVIGTGYTPINGLWGSGGNESARLAPAAIGTDGTNVLVAEFDDANDRIRIQVFNPTTLAVSATYLSNANSGFNGPVVGVMAGSFDFGSTRYVVLSKNGNHHWPFTLSGSTLTYQPNDAWAAPVPGSMSGFTWVPSGGLPSGQDARFYSTRAKNVANFAWIYKHTTHKWTGSDPQTRYAAATWRDTDAGGTGLHETTMSPVTTFSMKKRAAVTLTAPAAIPDQGGNDDPDAVGFYLGNVDATRANLFQQTLPSAGVASAVIGDSTTLSGTNPPSTNNFPAATPAKIQSADASSLVISGDGSVAAQSLQLRGLDTLSRMKFAIASATTNASGQLVVTHGLGVTPAAILLGGGSCLVRTQVSSSTTFTVECRNAANNALLTSTAVSFSWLALA